MAPPHDQTKIVTCVYGSVLDAVLDLRRGSPTFGEHVLFDLSADRGNMVYMEKGLAHGFYVPCGEAVLLYRVSTMYFRSARHGNPLEFGRDPLACGYAKYLGSRCGASRIQPHSILHLSLNERCAMIREKKCALVTGATGFGGSRLVRRLVAENFDVYALTRRGSGRGQLEPVIAKIGIIEHDGSTEAVDWSYWPGRPNTVFHLASYFVGEHLPGQVTELIDSNVRIWRPVARSYGC
jgi:hypothetical protein